MAPAWRQPYLSRMDDQPCRRVSPDGLTLDDMREGEVSLTDLWFGLHEQQLSKAERRPVDEAMKKHVRHSFPPPAEIDFRMST